MHQPSLPEFFPAVPEILLGGGACLLLLFGVLHRRVAALSLFLSQALIGLVLFILLTNEFDHSLTFQGAFLNDAFSQFMKSLILFLGMLVLWASRKTLAQEDIHAFEYPILILFSLTGMMLMVSAHDLLALFMGIELQSLSLYILTAIRRDDGRSSEAALKYFVLGALSTSLLLFGVSFVYGFTGTINFHELASRLSQQNSNLGLYVGLVFILSGLAFKISAVPFHMWLPDVYEGTPTSVTTFLASVPKLAAFALLIRLLMGPFQALEEHWQPILIVFSSASMIFGAFAALYQVNIKRLLAYSAISHMGYALIGVIAGDMEGIRAALLYIMIYAIMVFGAFVCLLHLNRRNKEYEQISELRGLAYSHPRIAFVLVLLFFSLAGIPPLAGFLVKLYVFQAAIAQGFYILAIIGVLTSVVSAAYYLYVIKVMVMDSPKAGIVRVAGHQPQGEGLPFLLSGITVLLLYFFVKPTFFVLAAQGAAKALFS